MNRSMLPNGARWIITGRCGWLSAPDVFEPEPLRQDVIELHRAELPLPADAVADDEVGLRARRTPPRRGPRRYGSFISSSTARMSSSARRQVSPAARRTWRRSGRAWRAGAVIGQAEAVSTNWVSSIVARNSPRTCSGVQNRWASSCVKPRTRVRPLSSPDCS